MRCYIVDDQQHGIVNLSRKILKTPGLELVGSETDPVIAVNKILSGVVQTDVVFADVEMPEMTGLELARKLNGRAAIIMVTAHVDYAVEAIDLGVVGYLTKPINAAYFLRALDRARQWLAVQGRLLPRDPDSIWLKLDSHHDVQIVLDKLIWLQANNKYVKLYRAEDKPLMVNSSLSAFESILPASQFLRIHKCHMVNLGFVTKRVYNQVVLNTGQALDIGPVYMEEYRKRLII